MVTDEDMIYLLDFCDHHFYGRKATSNFADLNNNLFLEPANYDTFFGTYIF